MFKKKENQKKISEKDIDKSENQKTEPKIELQENKEQPEIETNEKEQEKTTNNNTETTINVVEEKINILDERLQNIETTINKQAEKENNLQLLLDNVHEERTKYRDNFFTDKFQKPLIKDIIQLHDNVTTRITTSETEETINELNFVRQNLLSILERMNVETYENYFEPDIYPRKRNLKLHKIIEIIDTDKPENNNFVSEIIKEGFMWNEKVIRPQNVKIYKLKN